MYIYTHIYCFAGLIGYAIPAWIETLIGWMCEVLETTIADTKTYLVKKQAMTLAERLADLDAEVRGLCSTIPRSMYAYIGVHSLQ